MSMENVRLFYNALAKDEAMQIKLKKITEKNKKKEAGETQTEEKKLNEAIFNEVIFNEVIVIAKEAGYVFTMAELKDYFLQNANNTEKAFCDDELTAVSGGVNVATFLSPNGQSNHAVNRHCKCTVAGSGTISDSNLAN